MDDTERKEREELAATIAKLRMEHDPRMPGKFEGEQIETLYFWDLGLNGDGETYGPEGDTVTFYEVSPLEVELFEAPTGSAFFTTYESNSGFVFGAWLTREEAEREIASLEEAAEDEEEKRAAEDEEAKRAIASLEEAAEYEEENRAAEDEEDEEPDTDFDPTCALCESGEEPGHEH